MHAALVRWQAFDEAAVESFFDSLRLHAVLLDGEIGNRTSPIILSQILLGKLVAHTPLALFNDTVLVVSASPHLPIELGTGDFILPLKVGHLLASLCVLYSDPTFVDTDNDLFTSFLHPVDNHK